MGEKIRKQKREDREDRRHEVDGKVERWGGTKEVDVGRGDAIPMR